MSVTCASRRSTSPAAHSGAAHGLQQHLADEVPAAAAALQQPLTSAAADARPQPQHLAAQMRASSMPAHRHVFNVTVPTATQPPTVTAEVRAASFPPQQHRLQQAHPQLPPQPQQAQLERQPQAQLPPLQEQQRPVLNLQRSCEPSPQHPPQMLVQQPPARAASGAHPAAAGLQNVEQKSPLLPVPAEQKPLPLPVPAAHVPPEEAAAHPEAAAGGVRTKRDPRAPYLVPAAPSGIGGIARPLHEHAVQLLPPVDEAAIAAQPPQEQSGTKATDCVHLLRGPSEQPGAEALGAVQLPPGRAEQPPPGAETAGDASGRQAATVLQPPPDAETGGGGSPRVAMAPQDTSGVEVISDGPVVQRQAGAAAEEGDGEGAAREGVGAPSSATRREPHDIMVLLSSDDEG